MVVLLGAAALAFCKTQVFAELSRAELAGASSCRLRQPPAATRLAMAQAQAAASPAAAPLADGGLAVRGTAASAAAALARADGPIELVVERLLVQNYGLKHRLRLAEERAAFADRLAAQVQAHELLIDKLRRFVVRHWRPVAAAPAHDLPVCALTASFTATR